MGLFDKLFGDNKEAASFMEKLLKAAAEEKQKEKEAREAARKEEAAKPAEPAAETAQELAPAGTYWGEIMPAEENLVSFKGNRIEYFNGIFTNEFPEYRIEMVHTTGRAEQYTFYDGLRKALVVEILPASSNVKKVRRDCEAAGIPYLRYYYDHDGWWNVRSYVVSRTRAALNG